MQSLESGFALLEEEMEVELLILSSQSLEEHRIRLRLQGVAGNTSSAPLEALACQS